MTRTTIDGVNEDITPRVGQLWKELKPKSSTKKIVRIEPDGTVVMKTDFLLLRNRESRAKPERFNGKPGGFRLIEDAP